MLVQLFTVTTSRGKRPRADVCAHGRVHDGRAPRRAPQGLRSRTTVPALRQPHSTPSPLRGQELCLPTFPPVHRRGSCRGSPRCLCSMARPGRRITASYSDSKVTVAHVLRRKHLQTRDAPHEPAGLPIHPSVAGFDAALEQQPWVAGDKPLAAQHPLPCFEVGSMLFPLLLLQPLRQAGASVSVQQACAFAAARRAPVKRRQWLSPEQCRKSLILRTDIWGEKGLLVPMVSRTNAA